VLHDTIFTHAITTIQNSWKVASTTTNRIVI
jgi:hypothetical protein